MNIIEERRRKAWSHAAKVISRRARNFSGSWRAEHDVIDTMEILKEAWERDRVKPSKKRFAEACPDKAIGAVVMSMRRDPFKYWNGRS